MPGMRIHACISSLFVVYEVCAYGDPHPLTSVCRLADVEVVAVDTDESSCRFNSLCLKLNRTSVFSFSVIYSRFPP